MNSDRYLAYYLGAGPAGAALVYAADQRYLQERDWGFIRRYNEVFSRISEITELVKQMLEVSQDDVYDSYGEIHEFIHSMRAATEPFFHREASPDLRGQLDKLGFYKEVSKFLVLYWQKVMQDPEFNFLTVLEEAKERIFEIMNTKTNKFCIGRRGVEETMTLPRNLQFIWATTNACYERRAVLVEPRTIERRNSFDASQMPQFAEVRALQRKQSLS